ncbi:MAG TPA: rod shape-determining protein MreC [Planctomycetaceae bacterium]|nr:rod shape-determining protein MreC [Planctomycetaceae bacterium]
MKLHLATLVCCGVAVATWWAPPRVTEGLRAAVRDAVSPGARAVQRLKHKAAAIPLLWSQAVGQTEQLRRIQAERDRWRIQAQRLAAQVAVLHERAGRLRRTGVAPIETRPSEPLILADLVEARILGPGTTRFLQQGVLIGAGRSAGSVDQALVLEPQPAIDLGTDSRVAPGLPVYAGRCVVGRIEKAGRWVSVVQPITDKGYRGYAQLARSTGPRITWASASSGGQPSPAPEDFAPLVFGARGILEGTGRGLCRLTLIGRTEPVQVGDLVFTAERDGAFPYPMFYGTVVKADLPAGQPHWEILVQPAVTIGDLTTVSVLRKRLNPARSGLQAK